MTGHGPGLHIVATMAAIFLLALISLIICGVADEIERFKKRKAARSGETTDNATGVDQSKETQ